MDAIFTAAIWTGTSLAAAFFFSLLVVQAASIASNREER